MMDTSGRRRDWSADRPVLPLDFHMSNSMVRKIDRMNTKDEVVAIFLRSLRNKGRLEELKKIL